MIGAMSNSCETVVISDKAYNAIIRESFAKHPVETGGILLGYILDNGIWVVMEMVPPGINGIFQTAYFEYDRAFVNYLGTSIANQYREPLQVLGLWHRHPGSMDYFSSTDDGTNSEFASRNPYGVISGLVNIDPKFRLTMYHLNHMEGPRPRNIAYSTVDVEIGDDLIPEKFFELRYVNEEHSDLNPLPPQRQSQTVRSVPKSNRNSDGEESFRPTPEQSTAGSTPGRPPKTSILKSRWFMPVAVVVVATAIGFAAGWLTGRPTPDKMTKEDVVTRISKIIKGEKPYDTPLFKNLVREVKAKLSTTTKKEGTPTSEEKTGNSQGVNPEDATNHGN